MKRFLALLLACVMALSATAALAETQPATPISEALAAMKVDKSTQPRVLITTDLEVDDMNGILLTLMYACDYDIAGIVATAGMFHFNGDGEHTLAEITPNYRCEATTAGDSVENAGQLMSFRPVQPDFLTRIISVSYAADYAYLSQNNPNYPTPEYLLSVAKEGNMEFEGDYRNDTEGSNWIKACILDDDPRPLYIMHWGGINTTVRAFISIYEQYHNTAEWDEILNKVVSKVRISGNGEDNCRADSKLDELFPGLQGSDWNGFGGYGNYFCATPKEAFFGGSSEALLPYYKGAYLTEAFKFNHGKVLSEFHLMYDGQVIYGEPICYQYGLLTYIDWREAGKTGWASPDLAESPIFIRFEYEPYDWMCCQFGTASFIDLGLRSDIKNTAARSYTTTLFDELAARADWAVFAPEDCNHAPVVTVDALDISAKAGETVTLNGAVNDPDGDEVETIWWMAAALNVYAGASTDLAISDANSLTTNFTVPADAVAGDQFVITLEAHDVASRPMTRFVQIVITVGE